MKRLSQGGNTTVGNQSQLEVMTYENSIAAAVKGAEKKYREQSFDKIK
jgi:hypothetical protein